jgi:hypothetical protein
VKTRDGTGKDLSETDDKTQIEDRFISSQAFHRTPGGRVREITAGVQFGQGNLESFDPVTQEQNRLSLASIQHKINQHMTQIWRVVKAHWKNHTRASSDSKNPILELKSGGSGNQGKPATNAD